MGGKTLNLNKCDIVVYVNGSKNFVLFTGLEEQMSFIFYIKKGRFV